MEKKKLYIPEKILDSDDYVTGFGATELSITGVMSVLALVFGIVMNQITGNTFMSVMTACGIIIMTIFLVRRDMCNENVFQKIGLLIKNSRTQKQFKYQYTNIYEDILYEETTE